MTNRSPIGRASGALAFSRGAALLVLVLGSAACSTERLVRPLRAQESAPPELQGVDPDAGYKADFYSAQGLMIGIRRHRSWLGGDFDGDTSLTGPDTISIPDTDEGEGYGISIGGMNEGDAFALSYTRTDFDGSIGGLDADVDYRAFALEIQHYFRANEPVQPFGFLGLLYPLADLEDASTDGVAVGNAKLRNGLGLSAGGGVALWFGRRLALDVRLHYTYQWFSEAEGVLDDSETIDDDLDASSYGISVGLNWVLGGFS